MKVTFERLEGEKVWHVGIDDHHMTSLCDESLDRAMQDALETVANLQSIRRQSGAVHVAYKPLGVGHAAKGCRK